MTLRTQVFKLLFHLGKIGLLVDKSSLISSSLRTIVGKFSIVALCVCARGVDISKNWQKLHWFIVFHVSIWELGALFGAKPTKAPGGDRTEQTVDKSRISCRSYYFFLQAISFYESVQLMLLLQLSEGIKSTPQRTCNVVNYRIGWSDQWQRKLQNSKLNRKT